MSIFSITRRSSSVAATALTLAAALVLGGCAAPARVDQMQTSVPMAKRAVIDASPLKQSIAIKDVTGGKDTNPMWMSNVSSSDFEQALQASLRDAGLLSPNRQGSRFTLTAHMLKLDQPFFGASMTVTATVVYTLVERATGKETLVTTIASPYTAAWNSSFLGTERLKLANEGAVRENITKIVDAIIALRVDGVAVK